MRSIAAFKNCVALVVLVGLAATGPGCSGGGGSGGGVTAAAAVEEECTDRSPSDLDGDGLENELETEGWTIIVDFAGFGIANGTEIQVFANPGECDTDGDGLTDAEEFASRTDPSDADTDGDLLTDFEEIHQLRSNPNSADTDGDAMPPGGFPNPALFDGNEYLLSKTSPTLSDTDGDGLSDYDEIIGGGFNPRLADLPKISLEVVGDPNVSLNATFMGSTGTEVVESTLEREENSQTTVDSQSLSRTTEFSQDISVSANFQSPFSYGGSVSSNTSFKSGVTSDTSTQFTDSSTQSLQQEFQSVQNQDESITYEDGTMQVAMKVQNDSQIAVDIANLRVLAFRQSPSSAGALQIITGLDGDIFADGDPISLAPGGEVTFIAENLQVNWQTLLPFIENPSGLLFEVGSFELSQPEQLVDGMFLPGQDYAVVGQRVVERTGLLVIDYGDGTIDKYQIATNVDRNEDGSGAGISLVEALTNVVGIDFETEAGSINGRSLLTEVDGQATNDISFWAVFGDDVADDDGVRSFDDLILRNGERIDLVYLTDEDGDGLTRREELAYGCSDLTADSDQDGLTDPVEVREGWLVEFRQGGCAGGVLPQFTYTAFSSPRFVDSDQDGLTDLEEMEGSAWGGARTDPRDPDTDGDGMTDFPFDEVADDCPVSNADLIGGGGGTAPPTSGLSLHLRWDENDFVTQTVFLPNGDTTTATLVSDEASGGDVSAHLIGYTGTFYFPGEDQPTPPDDDGGYFSRDRLDFAGRSVWSENTEDPIEDPTYTFVPQSPIFGASYSLSAWVYRSEDQSGDAFIFGEQSGPALWLRDGDVQFEIDGTTVELDDPQALDAEEWHLYTVTVDSDLSLGLSTIRLYRDTLLIEVDTVDSEDIEFIDPDSSIDRPMFVGVSWDAAVAGDEDDIATLWHGIIDDVRVYSRALTSQEVVNIFTEGGFTGTSGTE